MDPPEIIDGYLDAMRNSWYRGGFPRAHLPRVGDHFDVLKQHVRLDQSLQTLSHTLATQMPAARSGSAALIEAQRTANVIKATLTDQLGWDPLQMAPSIRSGQLAMQVSGIPELLELILLRLRAKDLLEVYRTKASSPQIKLGLRPDARSFWRSNCDIPEDSGNGEDGEPLCRAFSCVLAIDDEGREKEPQDQDATVYAEFVPRVRPRDRRDGRFARVPTIGERCAKMLICQPPFTEMFVLPSCCHRPDVDDGVPNPSVVRNDRGLTVGDLLDATMWAEEEHSLCAYAEFSQHDAVTGLVNAEVRFDGTLELRSDDPGLPQNQRKAAGSSGLQDESEAESEEAAGDDRNDSVDGSNRGDDSDDVTGYRTPKAKAWVLRDYIRWKIRAAAKGRPVPTLQEFKAIWYEHGAADVVQEEALAEGRWDRFYDRDKPRPLGHEAPGYWF